MQSGLRVIDLFSCVGCHHVGLVRAGGFETIAFVEKRPERQAVLRRQFPDIPVHDDVETFTPEQADVCIGGPPCQKTSVAAAIHGRRDGRSLWRPMLRVGLDAGVEWFVVEQPTGNAAWEAEVCDDLSRAGFHVARVEFGARDIGAPYPRQRVFLIACTSLPRLALAWGSVPFQIERVARAADARGAWNPDQLAALRVDARSAGEMDRSRSRGRIQRIEALGDSNPPGMFEVIGLAINAGRAQQRIAA